MITLLTLIVVILVVYGVLALLAWQKLSIFLTYNTRYQTAEYEQAITQPKIKRPILKASKSEQHGREVKRTDELVDLEDLPIEDAMNIVESLGA